MTELNSESCGLRAPGEVVTMGQNRTTILTIEDDASVAELLCNVLGHDGCTVVVAPNGTSGLEAAELQVFDLIILDICLPDLDGWEVCRRLRNSPRTQFVPLIMLTAEGSESDRVHGLELGADDYVSKPFSPRELYARIRALLRRSGARSKAGQRIDHGELSIDADRREVIYAGRIISLTATEFLILQFLAISPGRVLSRSEISSLLREGDAAALDRAVDAHVKSIRRQLGDGAKEVETVRGFGYRLRDHTDPR
jgi:two-component system alkaline phosphatase synthesis response regulator PhoP